MGPEESTSADTAKQSQSEREAFPPASSPASCSLVCSHRILPYLL